ncbi:hypothetical protein FALBO_10206 [Fusarium albosuccineum]|uniref:Uncharacterized protein n=1 Tax=Fusarium albosuccineum TaxID=1237068 RepID=A0A8H4L6F8_9HYPO|nr:hypothetical protein FALBO_10206 [Fusarium albosuccineum]
MFGWGTTPPPKVPGDKVLPLHFFDDTPVWRAFILYSMFVFGDVLDPDKLHHGLEELVRRDGWQKLGARLRRNDQGALEYHIPAEFTENRPAINYTHVQHNTPAADHPIACQIPKPSTRPSIVGDPDQLSSLMHPEQSPKKLDDYVNVDLPQLGLHIVSFNDATIVSIYWPHTLFDAMGKHALMTAWSLILQGRQDEIMPLRGADSDPLVELGNHATEAHRLADHQLSTLQLVRYGISNIIELGIRGNENRVVCIPAAFIDKLREEALQEVAAGNADQDVFLSEGDVLCGWWARMAISHLPEDSERKVVLYNAHSLREVLSVDLLPPDTSYLSNAIGFVHVTLTVKEIIEKSVGYIASRIRQAICESRTREQVEAFMAMVRQSQARAPPFFGDPSMHMITYSNWGKAKLFEVDFSAAALNGNAKSPLNPSYIHNCQYGLTLPNAFLIIGKDMKGNYWLSGYLNKGNWGRIEQMLADL